VRNAYNENYFPTTSERQTTSKIGSQINFDFPRRRRFQKLVVQRSISTNGPSRERRGGRLAFRVEAAFSSAFTIQGARPNIRLVKFSLHLVWFIEKRIENIKGTSMDIVLVAFVVLVHPVLQCILYVVCCIALGSTRCFLFSLLGTVLYFPTL